VDEEARCLGLQNADKGAYRGFADGAAPYAHTRCADPGDGKREEGESEQRKEVRKSMERRRAKAEAKV
jgi:hypothetical protein